MITPSPISTPRTISGREGIVETVLALVEVIGYGDDIKVFIMNGSPKREGNTGTLTEQMAEMARDKGHEVIYHDICDLEIHDCRACLRCKGEGVCAIEDDMTPIYDEIREADVLVMGSPIYMGSETGAFKCFIDRLYAFMMPSEEEGRIYDSNLPPGKSAIVFFTCGSKDGHILYNFMNSRFSVTLVNLLGIKDLITGIVPGTSDPKDVMDNQFAQHILEPYAERI